MPEPKVVGTTLEGVLLIEPTPILDARGFFVRTMSADVLAAAGIDHRAFVHENQSRSCRGTLRGFHMRRQLSEAKLVRCARGTIYEVVVDLRPWSSTFLRWEPFWLDDEAHRQVLVPAGCAHGYQAVSEWADVCYKHDAYYAPDLEAAFAWNDPEIAAPWPIGEPLLSDRDRGAPPLAAIRPELAAWYGAERPPSVTPTGRGGSPGMGPAHPLSGH